jgi:UDP-glucose:(heptosyl)LPS alpha-1,3-glucosyltransferase
LDIIHTQGIGCVGGNVVTFHSGGYEERIKTGCHELKSQLLYFLEKNIMEIAEAIIVPSNLAKNSIMTFYKVSEKKLHVIPHGVDINKFHPINRQERTKIRARYGFREGDFLVYFSSTFKRRNLECLIKALPRIKNAKLIITGGGNFSYYARLSKDLGVSSRVMFLGYLPDIQEIYSIADVYVLPTLYDTFGLSILEAMASGVPVIVSKMAGSAELITNGKEGFILNKLTVDEIVDKLLLLIDNCELRSTMGNNARRTALKHTWQKVANDTLNVYRKVLS